MLTSMLLRRGSVVAAVVALLAPSAAHAQARGGQPAPPPRTVQNDSGRTQRLATDTTRNRRAANQDTTRTAGADSANAGPNLGGIRLRSIGPGMVSGRIVDLAVNPRDKRTWYVGVAAGGVWKTTNAGTTFTPVF